VASLVFSFDVAARDLVVAGHVINGCPPPNCSSASMPFGEIVCGAPGSGKSTYCYGKHQLFTALQRPISIVNLDPANENIPYPCAIDISCLITLQDAMDAHGLGPNGGMLYCMEYLEANFDWLESRLHELGKDAYVLFDIPGQVELGTNHESLKCIIQRLSKIGFRVRVSIRDVIGLARSLTAPFDLTASRSTFV